MKTSVEMLTRKHARRCALCLFIVAAMGLGGCTHTVYIDTNFPKPLVEKLPYTVGMHYAPEFLDYQYTEESKDRTKWVINSGEAQEALFNTMMQGMFNNVVEVDSLPPWENQPPVHLVLAPTIADFQYTLPRETKIKVYEIWVKYNVQVFNADGGLLADWIMTAYGKTPTGFMQSDEGALRQAIIVAMRDAGANLVLNFTKVPEVRAWLSQNNVQYSQLPEGANQ